MLHRQKYGYLATIDTKIADVYGLIEYYRYDCKIIIYDHVFKVQSPKIVEYSNVAEWILDNNKKRLVNFAVFNGQ